LPLSGWWAAGCNERVEEVATLTLRIIKEARWTPLTVTVATREQANAGRIPGRPGGVSAGSG